MNYLCTIIFTFYFTFIYAQNSIIGKWKTIDDNTGKLRSIVEIYEKSGKIFGKVTEILAAEDRNRVCENYTGSDKNAPILGMVIIHGLLKDGNEYNNGKIIDPQNGNTYRCLLSLEHKDKLKVRGYIGFSMIGRSQYWLRAK